MLGTPIWLGEKSSVCTRVIERLYGNSAELNEHGQYAYYGKVGGCLITGNEDGVKHCAMNMLYSLQHLGYTIPPQADAGWIGEAGPGPSYLDEGSGGPENDFTNRNTTFMTWNLLHTARLLRTPAASPCTATNARPGTLAAASTSRTPSTDKTGTSTSVPRAFGRGVTSTATSLSEHPVRRSLRQAWIDPARRDFDPRQPVPEGADAAAAADLDVHRFGQHHSLPERRDRCSRLRRAGSTLSGGGSVAASSVIVPPQQRALRGHT